ncbi:MAG: DUF2905 domain-containing protein [Desulfuromonadales bacterium]|jgi:hypothetical protein|nr:DUF2905 domain-containing protein [Desulfuromonadales bacterium]MDH3808851.1 DUF2905 domain-containing protein [Desulfuromonadales bacterium]MDH3868534.1 DUF2905 domain-containing protein [Desulfuromonadales bacterium]MDH4024491.1 DUF2905 domain-containing protein [Desulfuromonadales bacterium]
MGNDLGRALIILGLLLVGIGLFLSYGGKFNFLGRLPGDIRVEKENFSFFFPLGTCLLISLFFSLLLWLFKR